MKKRIALGTAVLLVSLTCLPIQNTLAATAGCGWDNSSTVVAPLETRLNIGGNITVGENLPIGSVIYSQRIQTNGSAAVLLCKAGNYDLVGTVTSSLYGQSSFSADASPIVFKTNIPGVGVAIWQNTPDGGAQRLTIPGRITAYLSNSSDTLVNFSGQNGETPLSFNIDLIKTDNVVGSGTITGSDLPKFTTSLDGNGVNFDFRRTSVLGSLTVIPATCNVGSNYYLPLGEHYPDEFNGVGSTAGSAETEIVLSGCPAFYGTTSYGVIKPNIVSIRLTPRNGYEEADLGISKLNTSSGDVASGVGVQLSFKRENGGYQTAKFNQDIDLSSFITFLEDRASDYSLGVKANYIQTSVPIRAGKADAQIEFMISYQ